MIRGRIVCLSLLVLVSLSTAAAEAGNERWKPIAGKAGRQGILYDPDSVSYLSRDVRRVRTRDVQHDGSQRQVLIEINCAYKIIRDVQVVTERPNKPPTMNNTPSEWREVAREPPFGDLFKILCR